MISYSKRYLIKIPKNIIALYCNEKKALLIKGAFGVKIIKLKVKLEVLNQQNILYVTSMFFKNLSNKDKKNLKRIRGTTTALIKQAFLEVSTVVHKKLNLIGVGYKASIVNAKSTDVIHFKLGYSHSIYFKIPKSVNVHCRQANKLFISGNTYQLVSQIAAIIRSYRLPEPYKGKGILHDGEVIILKEGKKI